MVGCQDVRLDDIQIFIRAEIYSSTDTTKYPDSRKEPFSLTENDDKKRLLRILMGEIR
jgi:hypothetical protein